MPTDISTKIVSRLGSPNSRIPLLIKDTFNSAGYTYYSYNAGGDIEAKDRLVDEVGTGLIWLGGIPVYRKLIDKTIFKKAGISPEVDYRVVKNQDYFKKALENAPNEKIANEIKNAGKNIAKTKNLNLLKFGMALGLTMLSYLGLTKIKQFMTKKNIEKEYLRKKTSKNKNIYIQPKVKPIFSEFTNQPAGASPSFGSAGAAGIAEEFVLNPIKNMIILDTGISTQRILSSRNKKERKEYAIKEGAFLFFVYGADKIIKRGINSVSKKIFNAPIDLEAEFLTSDLAQKILTDKNSQNEIKEFIKNFGSNTDSNKIYDFIFKNQDSVITQASKKSGIISVLKGTDLIDTRKYIDISQIQNLSKNLDDFVKAGVKSADIKFYLNKVKILKTVSTVLNVAACCAFLGIIVPKSIYKTREKEQNGNTSFHVKDEYEKKLQAKTCQ